jgi:Icc protein
MDLQRRQSPINILQITDAHLGELPGSTLLGLDTDDSFIQVAELAKQQCGAADWLLATGDISNDGSLASYQRFLQLTAGLAANCRWLPGNHDDLLTMAEAVAGGAELGTIIDLEHWRIVLLNSAVPGEVGGALADSELQFLQQALVDSSGQHVMVCLHHHPVKSGCAWLDQQQVANADAFFEVLDQFDHVRAVLWGHIHQEIDTERNGVRLLASPSSCIQFAANSDDFKLDRQAPGYRWLQLHADGQIDTAVERLAHIDLAIDFESAQGY